MIIAACLTFIKTASFCTFRSIKGLVEIFIDKINLVFFYIYKCKKRFFWLKLVSKFVEKCQIN